MLVGDIISMASLTPRLSTSTARLEMEFLTSCLQFINTVIGPSRQINMDRGPHASTKVGRTGVNVAIFLIQAEIFSGLCFDRITNSLDSSSQSFKDSLDIPTLLHGDDSKL